MEMGPIELVKQARVLLHEAAGQGTLSLTDEQLCELLVETEAAGRLVDSLRVSSAAEVDERSRYELGTAGLSYRLGERRGVDVVERIARVSRAEASRRVRVGAALRSSVSFLGEVLPPAHPFVAAAVIEGRIGIDSAAVIIRCLDQAARHHAPLEDLDAAEAALVAEAETKAADLVAVEARVWREALDPDGAAPRDDELHQRREFWIGRERNGITPFGGQTDQLGRAELLAAMAETNNPRSEPRFLSDDDRAAGSESTSTPEGDIITFVADPRTREQRQHDTFFGLMRAGLRSTDGTPTALATVMVTVTAEDLLTGHGVAWIDDVAEPISIDTVQQVICNSGFRRILLSNTDQDDPRIDELKQRFFTTTDRQAMAVRDGGCVWPGCTAPPSWCEAHHLVEWSRGGPTSIDNGALLCSAHHHMLHSTDYTMRMINGRPQLLAPPWIDPSQTWQRLGKARVGRARELARR